MPFAASNIEALLDPVRVQIGDTGTTPTYSDEFLHKVVIDAVAAVGKRWRNKYYVDNAGVVLRNTTNCEYEFTSPPVVQKSDERPIVLMASIMIKSGTNYSSAGDAVSWKDEEISYSNIESAKQTSSSLNRDIAELNEILPRKLANSLYGRLTGWDKGWQ